jgi:hypothetical protein
MYVHSSLQEQAFEQQAQIRAVDLLTTLIIERVSKTVKGLRLNVKRMDHPNEQAMKTRQGMGWPVTAE